ncbi:MAG: Thivi_2564 family membrane protein [Legionella sp.]|nr:Thivi_2564 family membrane protein [Legionella sp.]
MPADLLNLIALIIIAGVLMWVINVFIPMPAAIKSLLNVLVLIVLIIYILQFFGVIKTILPGINIFR